MNKSSYDAIQKYCDNQKETITTNERDFIIRKFMESAFDAIEIHKINNKSEPSAKEIATIEQTLLVESNLESFVDSAKKFYLSTQQSLIVDYDKKFKRASIWRDVGIGVLSAFLYSLLLVLFYLIAQEHIAEWLRNLLDYAATTQPAITQ